MDLTDKIWRTRDLAGSKVSSLWKNTETLIEIWDVRRKTGLKNRDKTQL